MPTVPWKFAFEECQALVMTPAQLVKCLTHARVAMADVALLVLDEIHRLRGDDLYATIMSYWYARTSAHARPRVLGLSASPVDESEKNEPTEEGVEEKLSLLERRIDALAWSRRPKFGQLEKEIVLYEVTPDVVAVSLVAELLTECKPGARRRRRRLQRELHTDGGRARRRCARRRRAGRQAVPERRPHAGGRPRQTSPGRRQELVRLGARGPERPRRSRRRVGRRLSGASCSGK